MLCVNSKLTENQVCIVLQFFLAIHLSLIAQSRPENIFNFYRESKKNPLILKTTSPVRQRNSTRSLNICLNLVFGRQIIDISLSNCTLCISSPFTYHLLQVLFLADVHHDQALFDQAEAHVVLGVPELYCDMWAGGTGVFHVQQALAVLNVPHHAVYDVSAGVLLEKQTL